MFKKKSLSKVKIVISEVYSDVYMIYLKLQSIKHYL